MKPPSQSPHFIPDRARLCDKNRAGFHQFPCMHPAAISTVVPPQQRWTGMTLTYPNPNSQQNSRFRFACRTRSVCVFGILVYNWYAMSFLEGLIQAKPPLKTFVVAKTNLRVLRGA